MISPQAGHQLALGVIEKEKPLQIRLAHRLAITTEPRRFLITEELHRHGPHRRTAPPLPKRETVEISGRVNHGGVAVVVSFDATLLDAVVGLCTDEGWPTFPADPERALRALLAVGTVTVVAVDDHGAVVGFAHALTDGVSAYLAELLVAPTHRDRGIGRELVSEVFRRCGTGWMDLLSTDRAQGFYQAMPHRRFTGLRLYQPGPVSP
jgi:ribosomal protein S18 acetylase RimI-like enzyme